MSPYINALRALEPTLVCPKCRAENTTTAATNQIHVTDSFGATVCDACGYADPIQLFQRRPSR